MIALTKECGADDAACDTPRVQQVCTSLFSELRAPFGKAGVPLQATHGIFDSNTLTFGGSGLTCGFNANNVLVGAFKIRGGGSRSSGTCDLHCLAVPNSKTATIAPTAVGVVSAAVDWFGTPNPPVPKYSDYSYYHEWQASVELRLSDGSAGRRLIGIAPDLERFFGEIMASMRTTT
jgi:hypothetical protein